MLVAEEFSEYEVPIHVELEQRLSTIRASSPKSMDSLNKKSILEIDNSRVRSISLVSKQNFVNASMAAKVARKNALKKIQPKQSDKLEIEGIVNVAKSLHSRRKSIEKASSKDYSTNPNTTKIIKKESRNLKSEPIKTVIMNIPKILSEKKIGSDIKEKLKAMVSKGNTKFSNTPQIVKKIHIDLADLNSKITDVPDCNMTPQAASNRMSMPVKSKASPRIKMSIF